MFSRAYAAKKTLKLLNLSGGVTKVENSTHIPPHKTADWKSGVCERHALYLVCWL